MVATMGVVTQNKHLQVTIGRAFLTNNENDFKSKAGFLLV
jgi:hypothetical protein